MEKIRSFVSIGIPNMPAVDFSKDLLRGIPGISVPKDVHLTLRFLGDVEPEKIKDLSARMMSLEQYRPFEVSLKGMGAFPNNREPRVAWIGADLGDPFGSILSDLDAMLDSGSVKYDRKPFKAHVTIGRVREPSGRLTKVLEENRNTDAGTFVCSEIFLMGSDLTSKGAVHSVIEAYSLKG